MGENVIASEIRLWICQILLSWVISIAPKNKEGYLMIEFIKNWAEEAAFQNRAT